jgi:hypothetical protein
MITDIRYRGRVGTVGLESELWVGCPKNHGLIHFRGKAFYLFSETSRSAVRSTYWSKQPERQAIYPWYLVLRLRMSYGIHCFPYAFMACTRTDYFYIVTGSVNGTSAQNATGKIKSLLKCRERGRRHIWRPRKCWLETEKLGTLFSGMQKNGGKFLFVMDIPCEMPWIST